MLNRIEINECKQNKPTQVVRDLEKWAPSGVIYETLLRRGVFKWLSVRRSLIKLKETWKKRITESIERQKLVTGPRVNYERGYRKGIEECRNELRALCHSDRWQVQDNDEMAERWFGYYQDILNFNTDGTPKPQRKDTEH